MKSIISRLNQGGLSFDRNDAKTVQAMSRSDWQPNDQFLTVAIPEIDVDASQSAPFSLQQTSLEHVGVPLSISNRVHPVAPPIAEITSEPTALRSTTDAELSDGGADQRHVPAGFALPTNVNHSTASTSTAIKSSVMGAGADTQFIQSIASRFAASSAFVLNFCDTKHARRSAESCLRAAMELAATMNRKALVVDAQLDGKNLSVLVGVHECEGIRDVLRSDRDWKSLIRPSANPQVSILPAGLVKLMTQTSFGPFELKCRRLFAQLREEYGILCVASGTAFDSGVLLVSPCCDGTFLSLDYRRTSRGLAKNACGQLKQCGARLLGCIAMSETQYS